MSKFSSIVKEQASRQVIRKWPVIVTYGYLQPQGILHVYLATLEGIQCLMEGDGVCGRKERRRTTGTLTHWNKHNSESCYFRSYFVRILRRDDVDGVKMAFVVSVYEKAHRLPCASYSTTAVNSEQLMQTSFSLLGSVKTR
ncbi:hypothetical protein EVAR_63803_1 [Eumeta japonica]|uniref:Uncharacterized protein n=1 Tax=Eumeta variegata TaxID=151549 RepID=A0A4C1ZNC9_EUMVA|nr:hypothetical protein EVAR_63803_1 [Eumeta japonica]